MARVCVAKTQADHALLYSARVTELASAAMVRAASQPMANQNWFAKSALSPGRTHAYSHSTPFQGKRDAQPLAPFDPNLTPATLDLQIAGSASHSLVLLLIKSVPALRLRVNSKQVHPTVCVVCEVVLKCCASALALYKLHTRKQMSINLANFKDFMAVRTTKLCSLKIPWLEYYMLAYIDPQIYIQCLYTR